MNANRYEGFIYASLVAGCSARPDGCEDTLAMWITFAADARHVSSDALYAPTDATKRFFACDDSVGGSDERPAGHRDDDVGFGERSSGCKSGTRGGANRLNRLASHPADVEIRRTGTVQRSADSGHGPRGNDHRDAGTTSRQFGDADEVVGHGLHLFVASYDLFSDT